MPETNLDFSVRSVPDAWNDAAKDAPKGTEGPPRRANHVHRLPTGARPDLMTGFLTGTAMAVISGAAWYSLSISAIYRGPWLAVLLGLLIAVAVRLGAGPAGPEMRVAVGIALYVVAVFAVAFWVSREQYIALNRRPPSFGELEDIVTQLYLSKLETLAAWFIGLGVTAWSTFALGRRRRR